MYSWISGKKAVFKILVYGFILEVLKYYFKIRKIQATILSVYNVMYRKIIQMEKQREMLKICVEGGTGNAAEILKIVSKIS